MSSQDVFDLGRRDFLTSPIDDLPLFDPANEKKIPLRIQVTEITGPEPAIPKRRSIGCRVVFVPPREGRAAQGNFATFARCEPSTPAVQDRDLGPGRYADRAKFAPAYRVGGALLDGFRHAIGLDDRDAKCGFEPGKEIAREDRGRRTNEPQRAGVPILSVATCL